MIMLTKKQNTFHALTSTVAANGYAGLKIIPRFGKLSVL